MNGDKGAENVRAGSVPSERAAKWECGEGAGLPVWRFVLLVEPAPEPEQVKALGGGAVLLPEPGAPAARVRFDWPAPEYAEAIAAAVRATEIVGLRVLRVDCNDWMTVADVADRAGRVAGDRAAVGARAEGAGRLPSTAQSPARHQLL